MSTTSIPTTCRGCGVPLPPARRYGRVLCIKCAVVPKMKLVGRRKKKAGKKKAKKVAKKK